MNWGPYFLGIASSLTALCLIWLVRSQITNFLNLILFRIYPKISGKYKIVFKEKNRVDPHSRDIVELSQFGSKVWGVNKTFIGDKCIDKDKIKGHITPSRILIFEYESISGEHHNLGTGSFRLAVNNKTFNGYITCLCANCQNTTYMEAELEKIESNE